MGPVAAARPRPPEPRRCTIVGITGTNGKTTTAHLIAVDPAGGRATPTAVIGTLSGAHTTPEAPELQARLAGVPRRRRSTRS